MKPIGTDEGDASHRPHPEEVTRSLRQARSRASSTHYGVTVSKDGRRTISPVAVLRDGARLRSARLLRTRVDMIRTSETPDLGRDEREMKHHALTLTVTDSRLAKGSAGDRCRALDEP